jgi:hypothetical protein
MSAAETGSHRAGSVTERVALARVQVPALHAELPRWGLVVWTAGNVSQRVTAIAPQAIDVLYHRDQNAYGQRPARMDATSVDEGA